MSACNTLLTNTDERRGTYLLSLSSSTVDTTSSLGRVALYRQMPISIYYDPAVRGSKAVVRGKHTPMKLFLSSKSYKSMSVLWPTISYE
jgi:hypothetical protein